MSILRQTGRRWSENMQGRSTYVRVGRQWTVGIISIWMNPGSKEYMDTKSWDEGLKDDVM